MYSSGRGVKIKLIYPKWPKLPHQPEFNLPPHGPVCFAAALPENVDIDFCDENVEPLVIDRDADLVAISCMLTCQIVRGWDIADQYRALGKKVIFGGIAVMLHPEETLPHADVVFLGEAEGHIDKVLKDFNRGTLKKIYNVMNDHPDTALIGLLGEVS